MSSNFARLNRTNKICLAGKFETVTSRCRFLQPILERFQAFITSYIVAEHYKKSSYVLLEPIYM